MPDDFSLEENGFDESDKKSKPSIEDLIKLKDVEVKIKPVKKRNTRKSKVSAQDVEDMSDKEVIETSSEEIKELYDEFNSFIENKTDVQIDNKSKDVIPTKIQVLDAALGGGFAIGTLNIIVGPPGCGKTMLAIRAMGRGQIKYGGNIITAQDVLVTFATLSKWIKHFEK